MFHDDDDEGDYDNNDDDSRLIVAHFEASDLFLVAY